MLSSTGFFGLVWEFLWWCFFFLCALLSIWDYTEGIDLIIIKHPVFKPFLNFCSVLTQARIQLTSLSSDSGKTKKNKDLTSGLMSYSISLHFNSSFYQVVKLRWRKWSELVLIMDSSSFQTLLLLFFFFSSHNTW